MKEIIVLKEVIVLFPRGGRANGTFHDGWQCEGILARDRHRSAPNPNDYMSLPLEMLADEVTYPVTPCSFCFGHTTTAEVVRRFA